MQFCAPVTNGIQRGAPPPGMRRTAATESPSSHRAGLHCLASLPQLAVLWCTAHGDAKTVVPAGTLYPAIVMSLCVVRTAPDGAADTSALFWHCSRTHLADATISMVVQTELLNLMAQ
jgi:hypothetical protein